ncbi:MAG: hypothetical protein KA282_03660 [Clostridia bacterium]|nr:hypothetical protein [Clostridia bacterium]
MKRSLVIILILILTAGMLTGCGTDQGEIRQGFMAILDKPASEETIKEASAYLDQSISKMDEDYASDMVMSLEHYIIEFNQDGVDYNQWAAKYEKNISTALYELYQIQGEDQKSPMAEDTVLMLSWEELAQRAYKIEQFIQKNKDQELIREDSAWIYENYMNAMIMGTNGTPIFDYDTKVFSQDAKTAYASFINKYPDSATAWALNEYFNYLNSIDFTLDYNDKVSSKLFFDTCDWLVSESGKRVFQ